MASNEQTICLLALDAADYDLLTRWDCENILLEDHSAIETYSHTYEHPSTIEVWTTVATGVGPEEHGAIMGAMEWSNPILKVGAKAAGLLPTKWREVIGQSAHEWSKAGYPQTDMPHIFEEGLVGWWPGVTPAEHVVDAVKWTAGSATESGVPQAELWANMKGNAGQSFGFIEGGYDQSVPIVGVHCHMLDTAGHTFCRREEQLRRAYEWVDEKIGLLREEVDKLIILSDHGMQVDWVEEDDSPGTHSMRSFISTNFDVSQHPETVYDVKPWIEGLNRPEDRAEDSVVSDTTEEQLRELGYL